MLPSHGRSQRFSSKGGTPRPFHHEFCSFFANQGGSAVWSPDGKHVLFSGRRVDDPTTSDWWVAPVDGGEPVRTNALLNLGLTSMVLYPTAWSGKHVYFLSGTTVEGINIFRVPIDKRTWAIQGPAEPLTAGPGMKIFTSVTRDGRVLFANLSAVIDAWIVAARPDEAFVSANPWKLTQDLMAKFSPSISRDGTKVAFVAFGGVQAARIEVRVRDLKTGQEMVFPMQGMSLGHVPRLNPDGSVLAYRDFVSGKWRTFIVAQGAASGREVCESCTVLDFFSDPASALVQVKRDELEKMNMETGAKKPVLAVDSGYIDDASLSPDDQWIAFLIGEPDGRVAIRIATAETPQGSLLN